MQKWEYLTEPMGKDDLPARGAEGWELVAVANGIMFYTRPVDDDDEITDEDKPVAALPAPEPEPLPEPVADAPVEPAPVEPVMEPMA